jgi:RNA polymerase sigma factor (sigma-70 family)
MGGDLLGSFIRHLHRARARGTADGLSDAELLERFAARHDEAAFEVLVWRHGAMVLGVCRRLLRASPDVEDAFQATFLTLVRKAGSVRRGEALAAWLYRVAYRIAVQARAEARRRWLREGAPGLETAAAPPAATDREPLALLEEEVRRLPTKYRLPVLLCYYQGRTTAEAARQIGCPRGTVLSRLAWARQRLRGRLTKRGVALAAGLAALRVGQRALAAAPAGLVQMTVRAALPGAAGACHAAASARAVAWTEGALRAMFMTKLKTVGAVLLALGLLGVGAGGWAYRPAPAALASPGEAADQPTAPAQPAAERRPAANTNERLDDAQKRLDEAQAMLEQRDAEAGQAQTEQRLRLLELEESMRNLERRHDRQRERETAALKEAEADLKQARKGLRQVQEMIRAGASEEAARPHGAAAERAVKEAQELVQQREEQLERGEAVRRRERIDLRRELFLEEEKLHRLERQSDARRRRAAEDVEAATERLRQLQGGPRAEPADRLLRDLLRKVDALQAEVDELRRQMRRTPPERDK